MDSADRRALPAAAGGEQQRGAAGSTSSGHNGGRHCPGLGGNHGEMGVITGQPRSATVVAEKQGATLFQVRSDAYEDLLQRSAQFNRDLLRQLAE